MERPHKQQRTQNLKKHWVKIQSKELVNKEIMIEKLHNYDIHCMGNTHKKYLHKTPLKQGLAIRLICGEDKLMHTKPLTRSLQVLNNKY